MHFLREKNVKITVVTLFVIYECIWVL